MEISKNWRLQKQRYGLVGEVCGKCDTKIMPPKGVCPCCASEKKSPFAFSGQGEIYSFTTVYDPPEGYEDNSPYTVAIVKLNEKPMVTAQLTGIDRRVNEQNMTELSTTVHGIRVLLNIGSPVKMVTRIRAKDGDKGPIWYGYKFEPDEKRLLEMRRAERQKRRSALLSK